VQMVSVHCFLTSALNSTGLGHLLVRLLVSILFMFSLLGCGLVSPRPDPQNWLITSYDKGTITFLHDGLTYGAKCTGSFVVLWNSGEDGPKERSCPFVAELVGHEIGLLFGDNEDNGHYKEWSLNVWQEHQTFHVGRWRTGVKDQKGAIVEEFGVTSVKSTP
jgi:hypothetical protein